MKNEDLHNELPEMWEPETDYNILNKIPAHDLTDAFILADKGYIATRIVESVEAGEMDPLKALSAIKSIESLVDMLTNKDPKKNRYADKAISLQQNVTDAAGLYNEKKFSLFGATFTKTEVATKYDWSKCNDAKLPELEKAAKDAADALKKRQEFLKTVDPKGLDILESETGETYTVYPPSKSSTSSVSVSFK
jgi:hypothetical protein